MEAARARLRLEAIIAGPPTAKCKAIVALLEELVTHFPDQLRLDVYLIGEQPSVIPSKGYQAYGKFKKVPSAFINGQAVAVREIPRKEELERIILQELARGEQFWQK